MTASTDYVPLLLNYFPLFVMIGDDLTCNGVKLLFSFFCPSTGRHLHARAHIEKGHAEKLCLATFAASVGDPQIPGNRRILFLNI
jgi:hypothetical protein